MRLNPNQVPRFCTIKELASASGFGAGTVHRVLSGSQSVRPETVERVLRALWVLNEAAIDRHHCALPEPGPLNLKRLNSSRAAPKKPVSDAKRLDG